MQNKSGSGQAKRSDAKKPIRGKDAKKGIEVSLALAPLDSTDMNLIRSWRNDYRIWKWCRQNDLISDYEQSAWFQKQAADQTVKMYKIMLSSYDEKEDKTNIVHVGVCGLTSFDAHNRRAEFSLYIAPAYQGHDLGKASLSCLLTHGFTNLGLNVIWGEVFEGNPALKMFEEVGFVREGVRRDFYLRDGEFIDAHLISLKADEWKPLHS